MSKKESKFPSSIPLPTEVQQRRQERLKHMTNTALRGVMIRGVIIAAELLGFVYLSSSALLVDALSSLVDVGASFFLIFCMRLADRPPDKNHPFGHGRFEPIAGLQLGVLLAVLGGGMFLQQTTALAHQRSGESLNVFTWIIPFCAVILLEISYQIVKRTAKQQNSPALMADAVHYRIDGINSLFATVALGFGAFFPASSAFFDHLGAMAIALLMVGIGSMAAKKNLNQLLDRVPDPVFFERVREAAMRVLGVLATEKVRMQVYGPDAHVSIDVEVDPHMTVEDAHAIAQKVRVEIQKEWSSVRDVIVHVEPYYAGDH